MQRKKVVISFFILTFLVIVVFLFFRNFNLDKQIKGTSVNNINISDDSKEKYLSITDKNEISEIIAIFDFKNWNYKFTKGTKHSPEFYVTFSTANLDYNIGFFLYDSSNSVDCIVESKYMGGYYKIPNHVYDHIYTNYILD